MSNTFFNQRGRVAVLLLVAILLAASVIVAAVVVIRSSRRITAVEVPVNLRPLQVDVGLRWFRAGIRRKLARLEDRYERNRVLVTAPTASQDSLFAVIGSEFAGVRAQLAELDSITDQRELERREEPTRQRYKALVTTVQHFVRTVLRPASPEMDSLDAELQRLFEEE